MNHRHVDWIEKWALYHPDQLAVVDLETGKQATYSQYHELASNLAYHLYDQHGVKKGDRLVILSENTFEHLILFGAAMKLGAVLVPVNFRLSISEVDYIVGNCDPKLCFIHEQFSTYPSQSRHQLHPIKIEDILSLAKVPSQGLPPVSIQGADPIFILYTSGTTGFPKGAIYSYDMMFFNSINTSMALHIDAKSKTINVMPFFHTGGWNVLTTPLLHRGGTVYLMRKFEPIKVLQVIKEEKITIFMGVPTMLQMISAESDFHEADLSSLNYIIVGGEAMPIPLIEVYHKKGIPIRQGYGMTEVGPNLTSLHHDDAAIKRGSIGRPNFYVATKVVDENGDEVEEGQPGELLLSGPCVTPGYWQDEKATKKAIRNGWFHSGDIVIRQPGEYFYVVDRIKNMYISGGENVYPAQVERVLREMDQIEEVAIKVIPDEKWGEAGLALIILKDGASLSEKEIYTHCEKHLAKFKWPREIQMVNELPKTETGKLDRKAISSIKKEALK